MRKIESSPPEISKIRHRIWLCVTWFTVILVMATFATLFAHFHWASDLLANLRVQQCLVILAMFAMCITFRKWAWVAVCLSCLAIHLPWFFNAFPRQTPSRPSASSLTITVSNVLTRNQRHEDIIADVLSQNSDVFAILELSSSLADLLHARCKATHPHSIVRSMDDGNFGIGLYSRHPFDEHEVFTLNTEIESISATLSHHGKSVRVIATHPLPPMGDRGFQLRNEHLVQLATLIRGKTSKEPETPVVLIGDLNLTPWSPFFQSFENQSGLRRACARFNMTPTWYRFPMFPFGLVIDHTLVTGGVHCLNYVVGPDTGSDHRSVTVTLSIDSD